MSVEPAALEGVRILDMTGARGNYCGKLFAELGADVVLVEPPEGSELRHQPPYLDNEPGLERSLRFAYQNSSKRSIVLDLDAKQGQEALLELASSADVVLESFMPGYLEVRGVGYENLAAQNPRLVLVSITPFGQSGPLADCDAPDLVCLALGGLLYLSGYADGAPMAAPDEQGHAAAGMFAAVAGMMALLHSESTGQGQHVDVSVQESVSLAMENAAQFFDLEQMVRRRTGGVQKEAGTGVFQCADGHVFVMAAGIGGNRFWPNLVTWLREAGTPDIERISGPEWSNREFLASDRGKAIFEETFSKFVATRTKFELNEQAQAHRVPLAPINTPAEVMKSPQLAHRNYFQDLTVAPGRTHAAPGAPYVLSATPWRTTGRAPLLGEHTEHILTKAGGNRREAMQKGAS